MQWKQAFSSIPVFQSSLEVQIRVFFLESLYSSICSYTVLEKEKA